MTIFFIISYLIIIIIIIVVIIKSIKIFLNFFRYSHQICSFLVNFNYFLINNKKNCKNLNLDSNYFPIKYFVIIVILKLYPFIILT